MSSFSLGLYCPCVIHCFSQSLLQIVIVFLNIFTQYLVYLKNKNLFGIKGYYSTVCKTKKRLISKTAYKQIINCWIKILKSSEQY